MTNHQYGQLPPREILRLERYWWPRGPITQITGRPRECWYTCDYPNRLDANEIRRRAMADGTDLARLDGATLVLGTTEHESSERIALAASPDRVYGWRVWLLCPRCHRRRSHLYPRKSGTCCRQCGRIRYSPPPKC